MKQYIISFICFSCLLLSGCNYLDTEPGDAISGDYFWELRMLLPWSNIAIYIIQS